MAEDISIELRSGLAIASIMARIGVSPDMVGAVLGVALPAGPRATTDGMRTIIGTAPGGWLVVDTDAGLADALAQSLTGLASISDQSGAYVVQRLSGPVARTTLQRGLAIDLHPDNFSVGAAATSVIAHIGVIIYQVDDRPSYDVAVFRSYADSFRHWLETTVAAL